MLYIMSNRITYSKKNHFLKILCRASSISSVLTFIFSVADVQINILLPIAIVFAIVAFIASIFVQFAPQTMDSIINVIKSVDPDKLNDDDLIKLYTLQDDICSFIATTNASISTRALTVKKYEPYV